MGPDPFATPFRFLRQPLSFTGCLQDSSSSTRQRLCPRYASSPSTGCCVQNDLASGTFQICLARFLVLLSSLKPQSSIHVGHIEIKLSLPVDQKIGRHKKNCGSNQAPRNLITNGFGSKLCGLGPFKWA